MRQFQKKWMIPAFALSAAAHHASAQFIYGGFSDVRPAVSAGQIVTNAHDDASGADVPHVRIFEYRFQNDPDDPYFTQDPGFNVAAGGMPAGTTLSFDALSSLTYWSGAGPVTQTPPPNQEELQLNFAVVRNTYITATSGAQPGFAIANVKSDGSLHNHLNAYLLASDGNADPSDGVVATPGVYFTSIQLDDPSLVSSPPIYLVYDNGLDNATFFSAVKFIRDTVVPGTNLANVVSTWLPDSNGAWSSIGNWDGGVASGVSVIAAFTDAIQSPRTITVDQPETVGTLNFDNSNRYTLAGSGPVTLQMYDATANINVFTGSHTISAPLHLASNLMITVRPSDGTLTINGDMYADPGVQITTVGPGTVEAKNIRADGLTVSSGTARILAGGTPASTSIVKSLSVADGATLDLTNNAMAVDYTGASPLGTLSGGAYSGILGLLSSGFGAGTWKGTTGILSSSAAASPTQTALAAAEASDVLHLSGSQTALWRGVTVDATSVLIRYTWAGDANLDGVVNADDYFQIDSNYNKPASGYFDGDFNYDGKINGDDYFIIDSGFAAQNGTMNSAGLGAAGITSAPEPAAALLALLLLLQRRRRRRQRSAFSERGGAEPSSIQ